MCHFPSWKETTKEVVFLTDKDVKDHGLNIYDAVGHDAIKKLFPRINGVDKEGFPCHPLVAGEIMKGKMNKLMAAGGYKTIKVNRKGQLHCVNGPAVVTIGGLKQWWKNGKKVKESY